MGPKLNRILVEMVSTGTHTPYMNLLILSSLDIFGPSRRESADLAQLILPNEAPRLTRFDKKLSTWGIDPSKKLILNVMQNWYHCFKYVSYCVAVLFDNDASIMSIAGPETPLRENASLAAL